MEKKRFDISIDHAIMKSAKASFDTCLKAAITRAISTGADEGSASLRISFEVAQELNKDTGEWERIPMFKFKAGYSVPTKESFDGKIMEQSRLVTDPDGFIIIPGQITMDEFLENGK